MLNKSLETITAGDIENLITNNVLERRTLEYKAQLPDNTDAGKKEFLADVSSFANTTGGDLIFGIKETNGIIDSQYSLTIIDPDAEVARLENILRDGIAPRIKVEMIHISLALQKAILIIGVKASLEMPHRVIFKSHDKFYARNSNGKYSMDVSELRIAFAQTSTIIERIKDFRINRILNVKSGEGISLTTESPFIAIHIIPLSAFNTTLKINGDQLLQIKESRMQPQLQPFYAGSWNYRINLLGVMAYSFSKSINTTTTYTQIYREGIIESVDKEILSGRSETKLFPMHALEKKIMQFFKQHLQLLTSLNFQPPFYLFLSLGNIKGYRVSVPRSYFGIDAEEIALNDLLLPEIIIEDFNNIDQIFRSTFDMIWNASGISRSLDFDENDKFID